MSDALTGPFTLFLGTLQEAALAREMHDVGQVAHPILPARPFPGILDHLG